MTYVLNFDVERQKAARKYYHSRMLLSIAKGCTLIGLTITALELHLPQLFYDFLAVNYSEQALILLIFVSVGFGLFQIISFPFDYHKEHFLECRYGLTNQSFCSWFAAKSKQSTLYFVLVLGGSEFAYNFNRFNLTWIFVGLSFAVTFVVLLSVIPSGLIETHFFDSQKLNDKALLARIASLSKKAGIKNLHVYKINAQNKTSRVFADSSGTGKSRKISLSDTLLNNYSKDEIESIVGHELGHHRFGHQLKFACLYAVALLVAFVGSLMIVQQFLGFFGLSGVGSIEVLPLFVLSFALLWAVLVPFMNAFSRVAEGRCDQYELELVKKPFAYISSIVKLTDQNLRYASPNRLMELFFYDHPSSERRRERGLEFLRNLGISR